MNKEPFFISMTNSADVLLDQPTLIKMKSTSYKNAQKYKQLTKMSSYEQTNNNQPYTHPDNGSMELPELSGFY